MASGRRVGRRAGGRAGGRSVGRFGRSGFRSDVFPGRRIDRNRRTTRGEVGAGSRSGTFVAIAVSPNKNGRNGAGGAENGKAEVLGRGGGGACVCSRSPSCLLVCPSSSGSEDKDKGQVRSGQVGSSQAVLDSDVFEGGWVPLGPECGMNIESRHRGH